MLRANTPDLCLVHSRPCGPWRPCSASHFSPSPSSVSLCAPCAAAAPRPPRAPTQVTASHVDERTNHQTVTYTFKPIRLVGVNTFEIRDATLMPDSVKEEIVRSCPIDDPNNVAVKLVDKVRDKVESWYRRAGLPYCYVSNVDGAYDKAMRFHVMETKISNVDVRFAKPADEVDSDGNEVRRRRAGGGHEGARREGEGRQQRVALGWGRRSRGSALRRLCGCPALCDARRCSCSAPFFPRTANTACPLLRYSLVVNT